VPIATRALALAFITLWLCGMIAMLGVPELARAFGPGIVAVWLGGIGSEVGAVVVFVGVNMGAWWVFWAAVLLAWRRLAARRNSA
jgi:hypothetical protein